MKTVFKTRLCILICLLLLIVPLGAVCVSADVSDDEKDLLIQDSEQFLETLYKMPDEQLDKLRENGGFYEVAVRSWYEDREIVGDYRGILSTETEPGDDGQLIINSVAEFEKYTSDIVIYYDTKNMSPINYVMNIRYSMAEKMKQAAQNMAVGLIVVFAVLVFLMFIISLFRLLAPKHKTVPQESADKPAPVVSEPGTVPAPAVPDVSLNTAEEEIAAVIAAAIAAASEEAPSESGYIVRSVRRKHSAWKRV